MMVVGPASVSFTAKERKKIVTISLSAEITSAEQDVLRNQNETAVG
jgi:hypothetical protein